MNRSHIPAVVARDMREILSPAADNPDPDDRDDTADRMIAEMLNNPGVLTAFALAAARVLPRGPLVSDPQIEAEPLRETFGSAIQRFVGRDLPYAVRRAAADAVRSVVDRFDAAVDGERVEIDDSVVREFTELTTSLARGIIAPISHAVATIVCGVRCTDPNCHDDGDVWICGLPPHNGDHHEAIVVGGWHSWTSAGRHETRPTRPGSSMDERITIPQPERATYCGDDCRWCAMTPIDAVIYCGKRPGGRDCSLPDQHRAPCVPIVPQPPVRPASGATETR